MTVTDRAFDLSTTFLTVDVEQAFIGCLMQLPPLHLTLSCHEIEPEDFTDPRIRVIFKTMKALGQRAISAEPAAVIAQCQSTGAVAGGDRLKSLATFLADIYTAAPPAAQTSFYTLAVLESSLRRRVTEAGTRIAQAADQCGVEKMLEMVETEHLAVLAAAQRLSSLQGGDSAA